MGGSKWRKVKLALGLKLNTCLHEPRTIEDAPPLSAGRLSDAASLSSLPLRRNPTTPTPSSSGLRLSKHSSKSFERTCAICLTSMKPGHGHAIFTAECSHSFHFHCITTNVKHGKRSCPVCRAKWKEIPLQSPVTDKPRGKPLLNNLSWPRDDTWLTVIRQLPPSRLVANQHVSSFFHPVEPRVFDDDERQLPDVTLSSGNDVTDDHSVGVMEVKTYPEVSAVPKSTFHNNFAVLIHLKAPITTRPQLSGINQTSRAPVDLVSVLDVSGSMAGSKLALLKRAVGFVIQNLGPSDRLSVIAFSSTARRLFALRRMTNNGKREALQAVNSLRSNGGTNIVEALKKGAKVMTDRKWKNPVCSIILLSDGQDTYALSSPSGTNTPNTSTDYQSLLPNFMHHDSASDFHIPVHTFGFGVDHDSVSMHSISETSGGTFSFIETESSIQDAFAQCIGGILSVVVQGLRVEIECIDPVLQLISIKSGNYRTIYTSDRRNGTIEVGDLYAEEERDFLVTTDIPIDGSSDETSLLKVRCIYKDPVSTHLVTPNSATDVKIQRPVLTGQGVVSLEVDKQWNRLRSAEAMEEARVAAERGDLAAAVSALENCRKRLSETISARAGDSLCLALDAELQEMQERMANRRVYETTGRAYVLSGLSSHSWQRATARGDSMDSTGLLHAYQTPSMVDMVNRSQTMVFESSSPRPSIRPSRSFPAQPRPR
ncbi:Anaphase-promoting complex (APC), subunit 11 [Olea europaea subsp. europaea]|uniref:Anaphase-promoting complex (APC), subunit 11 n=1 Tax=Olea europaea subsp. europaea TaxID=158383 RepID=A0A8S0R6P7_OLEEU|nr:Anaphase-promoting complex (APC), subunit 11 [Olea europaea subsp. europaea]